MPSRHTRSEHVGDCPDDGYPIIRETTLLYGGERSREQCANPWHPQHPGACPSCGSEGEHGHPRPAVYGETRAACVSCAHEWTPEVPLRGRG